MPDPLSALAGPGGRPLRVAHLTTVDMSLALLLGTELQVDVGSGFEVYGISAPGPYVAEVEKLGVRHVPVPSFSRAWEPGRDLRAGAELAGRLRRLRLDVLHTHTPKAGVLGRVLGRLARVPVVVNTCHGLWLRPGDGLARRVFVLGAEAVAARFSHAELYQNAEDAERLRWAVPAGRSRVVGNGTDLERFSADPQARERIRAELGVKPGELLVGGVGRQVAEKGIHEFGVLAERLAGMARFCWIGPEDSAKADAVRSWPPGVEVLGARSDMPAVYAALDVFVLPSYREGFSRSAMEVAACGLPMVLTDIRGCREIGVRERDLLLVPPGDVNALVTAVLRLLGDPLLRLRLGSAARQRALGCFDQRAIAQLSIETYAAVARRRGLGWTQARGAGERATTAVRKRRP